RARRQARGVEGEDRAVELSAVDARIGDLRPAERAFAESDLRAHASVLVLARGEGERLADARARLRRRSSGRDLVALLAPDLLPALGIDAEELEVVELSRARGVELDRPVGDGRLRRRSRAVERVVSRRRPVRAESDGQVSGEAPAVRVRDRDE